MLGYDAVNAALQSLGVREHISSYLSLYFLFSFPSFSMIEKESQAINKITDYYIKKFKEEFKPNLNLLYLAAIFDIDPKYDFAKYGEDEKASCKILKEGEGYLNQIFQEVLNGLISKSIIGKEGLPSYQSYLESLTLMNIPTSKFITYEQELTYTTSAPGKPFVNGHFFKWANPVPALSHVSTILEGYPDTFNSIQRPGINFNLEKFNFFNSASLPSTSDLSFLESNQKFFFEFYFFGDRNLRKERYLSFEEVFMMKEWDRKFVVTGMGVRLMTFISPEEFSGTPYNTWFKNNFPIWNINSFNVSYEKTDLGYKSKKKTQREHIIEKGTFSEILKQKPKTAINIISEEEGLIYDKAMVVNYDTSGSLDKEGKATIPTIHTRFPAILVNKEEFGIDSLFNKAFEEIDKLSLDKINKFPVGAPGQMLKSNIDNVVAGKIAETLYNDLLKKAEGLTSLIISDDKTKKYFTKIIPIETLLTLGPIYYSSLAEETGIREELKNLDGFVYKDYLKSINDLLENLSKFDEY